MGNTEEEKVTEYNILSDDKAPSVIESVNKAIEKGWEPLGPIQIDAGDNYTYFYQTMVRFGKKK